MADVFKARVRLKEGLHLIGKSPRGGEIDLDSKPAGVIHAGPTPMELFLQAIAGCAGMEMLLILRKRRLEPELLEIDIEGLKRDEVPRIFTNIKLTIRALGQGLTQRELTRAVSLSIEKYCSITNMLDSEVSLQWECEAQ